MRKYIVTASIFTILLTAMVAYGLTIAPAYAGLPPEEILKCYRGVAGLGTVTSVEVEDQFGTQTVGSGNLSFRLCELGLKHASQLPTGFTPKHWIEYGTDGTRDLPPLFLTDQFGTSTVGPGFLNIFGLLVPALKDGQGDTSTTAPHWTRHFFGVLPPLVDPPPIEVVDQFGASIIDPSFANFLLVPALKDGEGDLSAPHWTCYSVFPDAETPVIDPPSHTYQDQFNTITVDYGPAQAVCVKTIKQHEEGPSVGGAILPVDTTALFVAGTLNVYWILPMLGGIAGAVIAVRAKRHKKTQ